jgi:hypothetical protein
MKYGKNVVIIALLSSFFSCISTKEKSKKIEKETELKTETEKYRYSYLKKTTENQKLNFVLNLDSLLLNRYQANSQDTGFFFAELKNGKIEIIYIQPKTTETREEKKEDRQTQKETKKETENLELKKETKNNSYLEITLGMLLILCGFYILYSKRKNFSGNV